MRRLALPRRKRAIAICLALALLGSGLVLGLPALAGPERSSAAAAVSNVVVTPSHTLPGKLAKYTAAFKTGAAGLLPAGAKITVGFPAGTGLPSSLAKLSSNTKVNGVVTTVDQIDLGNRRVRIVVPVLIPASTNVTVLLGFAVAAIVNPGAGTYTGQVSTSVETQFVSSAPYTIFQPSELTIANASKNEGNAGTSNLNLSVNLAPASTQTVTVDYETANSTAVAPGDYTAVSAELTFSPGETLKTIAVPIKGDTDVETTEHFFVNLSGATNAVIADAQGVGTIVNDDSPPPTPNTAPVAEDDAATVEKSSLATTIDVRGNDTDADGDQLRVSAVDTATFVTLGTVAIVPGTPGMAVSYMPPPGFTGVDRFGYTIADGKGGSDPATVMVTVVDSPPVAADDHVWIAKDDGASPTAIQIGGTVLANDGDPSGDPVTIAGVDNTGTSGAGAATGGGTGLTYTPPQSTTGDTSFTYTISDGSSSDTATVFVHVVELGGSVSVTLCAEEGSLTLPGGGPTVTTWGFGIQTGADCSSATPSVPGPILSVPEGASVHVTLDNEIAGQSVSLMFPGQEMAPGDLDTVGISSVAAPKTYDFTAATPGTFLYESGAAGASGSERQVPAGLFGALVVRAADGTAYGTPGSAFDVERVLVLSEASCSNPGVAATAANCFHFSGANMAAYDLYGYAPNYWLINGMGYPSTPIVRAAAGQKVLLRYVNAGLRHHTMAVLGARQRVIARDGYPEAFPHDAVAAIIPTGETLDAIVTLPALPAAGERVWIYDSGLRVTNGPAYPGGILTFIAVP